MYQTSLSQFVDIFQKAMDDAAKASIPSKRISNIIELLSYMTYTYICRGFFERHKEVFTLLMSLKVLMRAEKLNADQFNCLIKGGAALDINTVKRKPKEWIPDSAWLNIMQLSLSLPLFKELPDSMARNDSAWRAWYDKEDPEKVD